MPCLKIIAVIIALLLFPFSVNAAAADDTAVVRVEPSGAVYEAQMKVFRTNTGESVVENSSVGGVPCLKISKTVSFLTNWMYFSVNHDFMYTQDNDCIISVTYYDNNSDSIVLQYSSNDSYVANPEGLGQFYKPVIYARTNSNSWKTVSFRIKDALFASLENNNCDFRISVNGAPTVGNANELFISKVEITKIPAASSPVSVSLGETPSGNFILGNGVRAYTPSYNDGDKNSTAYIKSDVPCRAVPQNNYLHFNVDDEYIKYFDTVSSVDLARIKNRVLFKVTYWGEGTGNVGISYKDKNNAWATVSAAKKNSGKWENAYIIVYDIKFEKGANGYDFRVSSGGSVNYFSHVEICKPWNTQSKLSEPNPRIITDNLYETNDIIIADYVVTDSPYNADATGVKDATKAIQSALDDCYLSGGGTVWVSAGKYLITDTLKIKNFVTLRGDWRDPDNDGEGYGTVIYAHVSKGEDGAEVFRVGGSGGVMGMTVYYPEQNAVEPIPYNYTAVLPGNAWVGGVNHMAISVINCTFINSYKGVGICTMQNDQGGTAQSGQVHEIATVKNIKGTCLKTGAEGFNCSDFETWENVKFSNIYWSNASAEYNPPPLETLNAWTKANGTGFILSGIEWGSFYKLSCDNYKVGIHIIEAPRINFCGQFYYADIKSCETGVLIDKTDTRWAYPVMFLRGAIQGDVGVVNNVTGSKILLTDCKLSGGYGGAGQVEIKTGGWSPVKYEECLNVPKATRKVLYNAAKPPYNAPKSDNLPQTDATAAVQAALDAAGAAGGGVVYLPAGWYRLDGNLSVPENTELRGASSVPQKDERNCSNGTVLFVYNGKNTANPETATAFITLNGDKSGARGFRLLWAENNPLGSVASYPYAIRGGGANQYVVNIGMNNAYNGIDFASNRCDNHYISKIIGCFFKTGIKIGASKEGWLENCMSNPNTTVRNGFGISGWVSENNVFAEVVEPITKSNEQFIWMTGGSKEHMIGNSVYGANSNIRIDAGTATLIGHAIDNCAGTAINVTGGEVISASFMYWLTNNPISGVTPRFSSGSFRDVNSSKLN